MYSAQLRLSVISWIIGWKINAELPIQDFKQPQEPQPLQDHTLKVRVMKKGRRIITIVQMMKVLTSNILLQYYLVNTYINLLK